MVDEWTYNSVNPAVEPSEVTCLLCSLSYFGGENLYVNTITIITFLHQNGSAMDQSWKRSTNKFNKFVLLTIYQNLNANTPRVGKGW